MDAINEFIRFDHIYYKAENTDKLTAIDHEEEVKTEGESLSIASQDMSYIHDNYCANSDDSSQVDVLHNENPVTEETEYSNILPSTDDFSELMDLDLSEFDSFLQSGGLSNVASSGIEGILSELSTDINTPLKVNTCYSSTVWDNIVSSCSPVNTPGMYEKSPNTFSESGYSTGESELGSPVSAASPTTGEDVWQESFSDLFPDLM